MLEIINNEYPGEVIVAIDEVGRGCFFGPVYACAIIIDKTKLDNKIFNEIKDSKKISKKKRERLYDFLIKNVIEYSIGYSSSQEIDEINILNATYLAMHRALDNIKTKFDRIIVDGNRFKPYFNDKLNKEYLFYPHLTIEQGDDKILEIACAAIVAKVERDECIKNIVESDKETYEKYDLIKNVGYGTKKHREAIKEHGITPLHRHTFGMCKDY